MEKKEYIMVSKLDAAKRQMEHAIKLFFHFGDVVVIHSVTAGAHEILCDIGENKGIKGSLRELDFVRPEYRKEIYTLIREPQNFFKHADREGDEDKVVQFTPLLTEMQLYDCCELYKRIVGEVVPIFRLFELWFLAKYHETIISPKLKGVFKEIAKSFSHSDRSAFWKALPLIEAQELK